MSLLSFFIFEFYAYFPIIIHETRARLLSSCFKGHEIVLLNNEEEGLAKRLKSENHILKRQILFLNMKSLLQKTIY